MARACFRFHGDLSCFLPQRLRNKPLWHEFDWRASIKDMIESLGPPHPEIDLIIVNGRSVGYDYIVQSGDQIDVFPAYYPYDTNGLVRVQLVPPYPERERFVLDTHLGRLASYLRMIGYDTLYRNDYNDDELARISQQEKRILLTRDIGLLKRSIVLFGYFVRETQPRLQLFEVTERYHLVEKIRAFRHCMKCNGLLEDVPKESILEYLSDTTASRYDQFHRCCSCNQIYWKGSHFEKMSKLMNDLQNGWE